MDHRLTTTALKELAAVPATPCLSLYQPTHRHAPDNQQDRIRFGNLLKKLETSLLQQHTSAQAEELLEPFSMLALDTDFWKHTLDGLAVLAAPGFFRAFRVQRKVPELAIVADSFHTKPLRRFLQSIDRYQALALSRGGFRLLEGNRNSLDEIDLAADVPSTITEALGAEVTESRHTVSSYGGAGGAGMHHGHGGRKDEVDKDAERFFRIVDRAVFKHYSRVSHLPLILVALTEHHNMFHKLSHNPFLMAKGLTVNPEGLSNDELRQRIWELVEPEYISEQVRMAETFTQALGQGLASDDIGLVAQAAANGRVTTLLIESGRQLAGHLDSKTGTISKADLDHPEVDDLLDDLGEMVEAMGGKVYVIPVERMPVNSGLAATFRY
jgi:hypothetical protein